MICGASRPSRCTTPNRRQVVAVHPKDPRGQRIVGNQLVTEWVQATRYTLLEQKPVTTDLIA